MSFIHLHGHSHYSLLDGMAQISEIVGKAKEYGMNSVALTDHGNLFGALEFYLEAKKQGVRPILGCEVYVAPDNRFEKTTGSDKRAYHLILLAKTTKGYKNLIQLVSRGYTEGFYFKPRIDFDLLSQFSEDLIASTACIGGEIPQLILSGKKEQAIKKINQYLELFGKDHFFLEIQNHGLEEEQILIPAMVELSKITQVPLIATNDFHYIQKEDSEAHDVLLCIGTGKKQSEKDRITYKPGKFYFKSEEEMLTLFPEYKEAINNTQYVADMCEAEIPLSDSMLLPQYGVPNNHTNESYLKELCQQGLQNRYQENITDDIQQRLDYELRVINKMGFAEYFLIVWDFVNEARKMQIAVGPGRGSAVGSLVAYTLGITDLDPIEHNLLFERFLNEERVSMPDIDIDFQDDRRDDIIDYVRTKYGDNQVSGIITFGTLKARAAIRDVGRVLEIPLPEINKIAKLIGETKQTELEAAFQNSSDLRELIQSSSLYQKLWKLAVRLEGFKRHHSTHASGIVIGNAPLLEHVPLSWDNKTKKITTQYTDKYLEQCGLLKMDFLGLSNLTIISDCIDLIEEQYGKRIDPVDFPLNDEKTFQLLKEGKSLGLFQLESAGMQKLLKALAPDTFNEIISLIALYRPGPLNSGMTDSFVKRKHKLEAINYEHPLLEPILRETYGVVLYQEQVMKIAQTIAGFSLNKADELRRAMGKKKVDVMQAMEKEFVDGAIANGIDEKWALSYFDKLKEFSKYGFNKSHSAAYAMVTYRTAYLKANYTTEFFTALLNAHLSDLTKLSIIIAECKQFGIDILPPHVNNSQVCFSIESKHNDEKTAKPNKEESTKVIRFGLSAIKHVGEAAVDEILVAREENGPFEDIFDFCSRVSLSAVNKRAMENLIYAGALDGLGGERFSLFDTIETAMDYGSRIQKNINNNQQTLFGDGSGSAAFPKPSFIKSGNPWSEEKKETFEKEVLGVWINHPMLKFSKEVETLPVITLKELEELDPDNKYYICGAISSIEIRKSKSNNTFAVILISDLTWNLEFFIFPTNYESVKDHLTEGAVYVFVVQSSMDIADQSKRYQVEDMIPINLAVKDKSLNKRMKGQKLVKTKTNGTGKAFSNNGKQTNAQNKSAGYLKDKGIEPPESRAKILIELREGEFTERDLHSLRNYIANHRGPCIPYLCINQNGVITKIMLNSHFTIDDKEEILQELARLSYVADVKKELPGT